MINKIEKFFVDILIKIKRKYKYHQLKKFYKIKDDSFFEILKENIENKDTLILTVSFNN